MADQKEVLLEDLDSMDIINIKMLDMHFDNIEKVYLGYPSKSHASAQIVFDNNMAMSAMSENQAAAWEFMKYYLTNFEPSGMPVFEDKFEAQLYAAMHEYEDGVKGHNHLSSNLTSQQADTLRELAYTASGYKQYDMAVYNIVYEEAMSFISGQNSAAEAAAVIQNRVQLYLDEKNRGKLDKHGWRLQTVNRSITANHIYVNTFNFRGRLWTIIFIRTFLEQM